MLTFSPDQFLYSPNKVISERISQLKQLVEALAFLLFIGYYVRFSKLML